jgi:hypothetical protein
MILLVPSFDKDSVNSNYKFRERYSRFPGPRYIADGCGE